MTSRALTCHEAGPSVPYIYTPDEIARILDAAGSLRYQKPNPLRRQLYVMLFGLIAATGLRVCEALGLKLDDIQPGGVLHIRETKFRKSRLVPLHATVIEALDRYLALRRQHAFESPGCSHPFSIARCATPR